jgi:hypothetical protein
MADSDSDYVRSIIFHFLRETLRVVHVVLVFYVFYKVIIIQPEVFLNVQTFLIPWVTFYVSVVVITACVSYVNEERNPITYLRQVFFTWPVYFSVGGIFVFYSLPFALPSLRLLF